LRPRLPSGPMPSRPVAGGGVRADTLQALPAAPAAPRPRDASGSTDVPSGVSASLAPDGELNAQRDAPVGGQAVLEGVMMRGVSTWAVAVRKPSPEQLLEPDRSPEEAALGEIEVSSFPLTSVMRRHRVLRLPILRGIVALGGSLAIGFRALEVSANAQLPPEEEQEIPRGVWAGTVVLALAVAFMLCFLVPVGLTSLIKDQLGSSLLFWLF